MNETETTPAPVDVMRAARFYSERWIKHQTGQKRLVDVFAEAIMAERERATKAERERCEKIADDWIGSNHDGCAESIHDAIRQSNQPA